MLQELPNEILMLVAEEDKHAYNNLSNVFGKTSLGWYLRSEEKQREMKIKFGCLRIGWYENGKISYERNYKDDKLDGVSRNWFENGQISFEHNYKDGKKDGLCRSWYENGKLHYELNYKDDKQDGVSRSWYDNGQQRFEHNYKDGKFDINQTK